MSELTIHHDGVLSSDNEDHPADTAQPASQGKDKSSGYEVLRESGGDPSIRSKPLIELLKIAEVTGVITGWSISGPSLVLRRGEANILVRAVDAGGLLVRMMAEKSTSDGVDIA